MTTLSPTPRSTVGRHRERARTDRAELYAVLDAGLVCHLALVVDGAPVVLPTGYGRVDDTLYVHGSTGAGWLRAAADASVCVSVTHLDELVYSRAVFSHSMNYRSAVVHATARRVTDPAEALGALRAVVEQLTPGSWDHARHPTARELAATTVLAVDLTEASVKVRTGPPGDLPEDLAAGGGWAGVVPLRTTFDPPRPCPTLPPRTPVPSHVHTRRV